MLARMEHRGIELNVKYLEKFADEVDDLISDYEQQIYGYADQEFNIGSPSQLAEILFDKIKLPAQGIKKGKTGYSTAASELDKLRGQHAIIDLITQYREVAKLKNTYIDTLPRQVDENSRLHTTFALTIAQTGRLSSNDPNLQNIPTRTDLGRRIRTAFVAGKGRKLVSADYSQFELRLAAVLAKDKELIEMFNRGADIHATTAAQVYGREQEDVTKQQRRAAKVINFGIMYGMSPHGLSKATGMGRDQAATFIDRYKDLRKPLFDYMDTILEFARKKGYVETLFGRRRPMPDIKSSNFMVRQAAERAAINMPIQGTEADLMKLAMVEADRLLAKRRGLPHTPADPRLDTGRMPGRRGRSRGQGPEERDGRHLQTAGPSGRGHHYRRQLGRTMNSDNDKTLQAYNANIQDYVAANRQVVEGGMKVWLDNVLKLVPEGGRILEIGSGYGRDAAYMETLGYDVLRTDAAEGFVDLLKSQGHKAEKLNALTDDFGSSYDLVFAHAVFLHFKPEELKLVLHKCFDCLKPGAVLAFSVKEGEGDGYPDDYLGGSRYFRFWKKPELQEVTEATGFSSVEITERQGTRDAMLQVIAKR